MAATRPVVLVYQEFASLVSVPATPVLNCLVAGPAYWIQDWPEDKDNLLLPSTYGLSVSAAAALTDQATGASATGLAVNFTVLPNNKPGAILDAPSLRIYAEAPVVEFVAAADGVQTLGTSVFTSATGDFVDKGVRPGDKIVLTDSDNSPTVSSTVVAVTNPTTLVLADEPDGTFGALTGIKYRIQRTLPDTQIAAAYVDTTGGNNFSVIAATKMTVSSAQVLDGNGNIVLPERSVVGDVRFAKLYAAYRSFRHDLQEVGRTGASDVVAHLGKIDARNPLAVGVSVATANAATEIQYYGVNAQSLQGYNAMFDSVAGRDDIYAIVPLIQSVDVLVSARNRFDTLANPSNALAQGIPQQFCVCIGQAAALPTLKILAETLAGQYDGATGAKSGDAAPVALTYWAVTTTGPAQNFIAAGVLPGDIITVADSVDPVNFAGTYTVTQVLSATEFEATPPAPAATTDEPASFTISRPGVGSPIVGPVTVLAGNIDAAAPDPSVSELTDPDATFLTSGVIPGDTLQFPKHPGSFTGDWSEVDSFTVDTVASNTRLRIVYTPGQKNTAAEMRELPHGATRTAPVTAINSSALPYRVVRVLSKADQATALVEIAASIGHRRVVNVWPDLCDITDLVDGSLPRSPSTPDQPQLAVTQTGVYLAAAVGGMTASLPSQQGFTNLSISGIKRLYNSGDYFSQVQISTISNGGNFVFYQDNPQAAPYVIHQLTTDVSILQFMEFSMVKNFDWVSRFFAALLDPFLGQWNVNKETLTVIQATLNAGIRDVSSRVLPKIGAPIEDGTLTSIGEDEDYPDRIQVFLEADFPAPLNTAVLHLVSR